MARTNRTRFVILGALTEGPKTGYDIKNEIEAGISHFWQESFGQLYPELHALAREGLAERTTERTGRRERHVYSITDAGRAALSAWLEEPVEESPTRIELLLKLIFGRSTRPEVLMGHVRAYRERARRMAAGLEEIDRGIGEVPADHPDLAYWRMTLRLGQAIARARLGWAEETLAELARIQGATDADRDDNDTGGKPT